MTIRFAMLAAQCVAIAFLNPVTVVAEDISQTFLCDKIDGFYIGAPDWQPKPDGYANTKILVSYKSGNVLSHVTGFRNDVKVMEADGFGVATNAGFSIAVFGGEFLETYVVNVGTQELLHTSTRAGSGRLPNAIKSFRGFCKPAGDLVRFSNRPVWVKRFQTSIAAVSMSLTGSCFSSKSAPGPFHYGIRGRGGTI